MGRQEKTKIGPARRRVARKSHEVLSDAMPCPDETTEYRLRQNRLFCLKTVFRATLCGPFLVPALLAPISGRGSRREALGEPCRGAPSSEFNCLKSYPQANTLKDNRVKNARARVTVFESLMFKGLEGCLGQR